MQQPEISIHPLIGRLQNTPEIVQNFYDHQVLLGYKNSRTMCVLHDTAVNNSHTLRID